MDNTPYTSLGGQAPGFGMPGQPMPPTPAEPAKAGKRAKSGDGKPVTKSAMSRQFKIAALFSVIAALVIVTVFFGAAGKSVFVVRSAAPIAAGTAVDPTMLEAVALPTTAIEAGTVQGTSAADALSKARTALGAVTSQYPIPAHAQIHPDQFGAQVYLGKPLAATERLMSLNATVSAAVAGQLKAGDHVDIVGVTTNGVARMLNYNVPVVAVTVSENRYNTLADQQSGSAKNTSAKDLLPGDPVPGIYTVRVPADKVVTLAGWNEAGKLYLVYRPANAQDVQAPDFCLSGASCK
jgi:Flp pilus assembly protein CpaB